MKWNIVNENWQQFKRRLRALWGQLIGEDRNPTVTVHYSYSMNTAFE